MPVNVTWKDDVESDYKAIGKTVTMHGFCDYLVFINMTSPDNKSSC